MALRRPIISIHRIIVSLNNPVRCLCKMVNSPEFPEWFNTHHSEQSSVMDSEDDFVLPTNLVSMVRKPVTHDCRQISNDDTMEVCGILNKKFASPEEVVQALDSCSVEVSNDLVDTILKRFSNDWVAAHGFFKWAGSQAGYAHSPQSCNMMVDILGKLKQFDSMWGLVEDMVQLGGLVSLETMTKVMRRLARAGRWVDTIKVFQDIDCFGVAKDTVSMNVLLDTLCKERKIKHARDAFLELRKEIPPNASSFNALIHGCCKVKNLEEARRTLEEMREFGLRPCVISYTSLIEAYCVEKDFRMVDAILEEMRDQGCIPNVVTYTIMMHALGKAGKTQEALDIRDRMKKDGYAPDTSFYNSLIYILGRAGRLRDSNNIYEEMCKNGVSPDITTYNTLISVLCVHSQDADALKLLRKMEESSCKPNVKTYAPLLKLCCRRKWMKILFYLLAHMLKRNVSLDFGTYTLLVHGLCRNGKIEQSCLYFQEMVRKGLIPKQHTYNLLIERLESKNMDEAKTRIQELMTLAQSMKQHSNSVNKHEIDGTQINSL